MLKQNLLSAGLFAFAITSLAIGTQASMMETEGLGYSNGRVANGPQDHYYAEIAADMQADLATKKQLAEIMTVKVSSSAPTAASARAYLFNNFNRNVIEILNVLSAKERGVNLNGKRLQFLEAMVNEIGAAKRRTLVQAFLKNQKEILNVLKGDSMKLFAILYARPELSRLTYNKDAKIMADSKAALAASPIAYVKFIDQLSPVLAKLASGWSLRDRGMDTIAYASGFDLTYHFIQDMETK